MTKLEAHARLAAREDRSVFDGEVFAHTDAGQTVDIWPAFTTALASLSGGLDDATSGQDLDELVEHGASLLRLQIVTCENVRDETEEVLVELMQWGDEACSSG